jgi:glyoxylase-like metal-dependent hydrolase (beta-lactamase superfamily II)
MTRLSRLVEVAPQVYVARSRRYATATTVLLDGHGGALVVDPSWDADELAAVPVDLAALGVRCVAGLATHMHYDHVLWHPDLGDVPRWSTPGTVRATRERRAELLAPLLGDIPDDLVDLAAHLTPLAGAELDWRGPKALIHTHDAHAEHHLALEIPDWGLLLAGDMLSDAELPMPDSADLDLVRYRAGLDSLHDAVRRSRLLVPGHGSDSWEPMARWDADHRYLDDLLTTGDTDDPRAQDPDMAELHAANVARARRTPAR